MSEETAAYQGTPKSSIITDHARNTFAAYGLEILKQSVLLVLYDETETADEVSMYAQGLILTAGAIRERLDILRPRVVSGNVNALIQGVLDHLQHHGQAHHYHSQGWAITAKGVSVIEGSQ